MQPIYLPINTLGGPRRSRKGEIRPHQNLVQTQRILELSNMRDLPRSNVAGFRL